MHDGLWTVEFLSENQLYGKGVIVLTDGKLIGGDLSIYYTGSYEIKNSNFHSVITCVKYGDGMSIFGNISHYQLEIKGIIDDVKIEAVGHVVGNDQMKMKVVGIKREDL